MHLLSGIGRTVVDDVGLPRAILGGPGGKRFVGAVEAQPSQEGGRLQPQIDKAGPGDRDIAEAADVVTQCGNELFGQRPRIGLLLFGVGEDAVGLKIAVRRIGRAHVGSELGRVEPGGPGSRFQGGLEVAGDIKRELHC